MRRVGRRAGRSALVALVATLFASAGAYAAPAASAPGRVTSVTAAVPEEPVATEQALVPSTLSSAGLSMTVSSVSPAVAVPGQVVIVTGTIHNSGAAPVTVAQVRLVRGTATVDSRAAVTAWSASEVPAAGAVIARTRIAKPIPGGGFAAYRLRVKGVTSLAAPTWGTLPVSVEAGPAVLHTFLGYQRIKEYEPLSTAWVVPLTLDKNPALWGPPGAAREKAWRMALGPSSRLDRLLVATETAPVTWAVDPVLLRAAAVPPGPTATPSPSPTASATSNGLSEAVAAGPEEAQLRTDMATRLTGLAAQHGLLVLPTTDADVAAAAVAPGFAGEIHGLVTDAATVADTLGARADIAWPAGGTWSVATEKAITAAYGGVPAAAIVDRSALTGLDQAVGAVARTHSGTPLLIDEDSARAPAMQAMSENPAHGAGAATQQLVAATAVVLGERPGVHRDLLLALPRGADISVTAAASLFSTVGAIPWLTPATVADLVTAAAKADRTTAGGGRLGPGATPLRRASDSEYGALRSASTVAAQIRSDGDAVGSRWSAALDELLSAQWRGAPAGWQAVHDQVAAEVEQTVKAVHVAPQTISFLADRGRVQLTVVNDLDVQVENITVDLVPDNPRLRIDTAPNAVRIGPHSRTTIAVDATALAAGPVRITARILGPTGVEVGREEVVQVTVTPTGSWIYWGLGGIATLAFGLGLVRNLRRRGRQNRQAGDALTPVGSHPGPESESLPGAGPGAATRPAPGGEATP